MSGPDEDLVEDELAGSDHEPDIEYEDWSPPAVPRWWGWLALVLSAFGFGDSLYLTIDHFSGALPSCPATGVFNCALVTTSKYSHVLGMPVALLGLIFYTSLVVVNLPPLWQRSAVRLVQLRLLMALVGMLSVCYLVFAEFQLKAICPWCTGVHVVTTALFVLVLATFTRMMNSAQGAYPEQ